MRIFYAAVVFLLVISCSGSDVPVPAFTPEASPAASLDEEERAQAPVTPTAPTPEAPAAGREPGPSPTPAPVPADSGTETASPTPSATPEPEDTPADASDEGVRGEENRAQVVGVSFSGSAGAYNLSVTVRSPDSGCEHYADWWEVVTPEGRLIYRRVLLHSHVDEQPFTRSGGPVNVEPDATLIVRAHMNATGYGTAVMRGSVADGFSHSELPPTFAADLESSGPLPTGCAF